MDARPPRSGPSQSVSFLVPHPDTNRSLSGRDASRLHHDDNNGGQRFDDHGRGRMSQAAAATVAAATTASATTGRGGGGGGVRASGEPIDPQLTARRDLDNDPGYAEALKAWARFRFVRAGWFTAQEAIDYVD